MEIQFSLFTAGNFMEITITLATVIVVEEVEKNCIVFV
jgi:hypothetical protein